MIEAHDLDGRAVVDLETAKKVGYVDEILLDTDGGRIAALQVTEGSKLTGGKKVIVPTSAVESIGPEAIMVRANAERLDADVSHDAFPRLSHVKGRKVVTEGGKLLGSIDDVLIDGADGRIVGYTLKDSSWTAGLSDLFSADHDHRHDYVRGDANLRLSEDLLVVPENAVVHADTWTDDDHPHDDRTHERSAIDRLSHPTSTTRTSAHVSDTSVTERHRPARDLSDATFTPAERTTTGSTLTAGTAGTERWDDVRPGFRSRWEKRTGSRGIWEEHEPHYRYGWEMANRPEYRGRSWAESESDLRRDWESRHHDSAWDRAMDAIRDAWDGVTDRHSTDVAGYRATDDRDEPLSAIERLSGRRTHHEPVAETERTTVDDTRTYGDSKRSLL